MLKAPPVLTLSTGLTQPEFAVVYVGAEDLKCQSHYLQNWTWVETLKATVKGIRFGNVDGDMIERPKKLLPAMQHRLHFNIEEFVHPIPSTGIGPLTLCETIYLQWLLLNALLVR